MHSGSRPRQFAFLLFLALQPAFGQMNGHGMEMQNEIPPSDLPIPNKLTGIGNIHLRITATPEAQMWFDQGLNLLHDFWDYESARAFEQSVRVDPQCAMCYWGLYKAEAFYHSLAQGYAGRALATAASLKDKASPRERLYIEASLVRKNETAIFRDLVKQYPEDTEAQIFLASAVGGKEALSLLESIFKLDPDNSAANHYYIHDLEGTPQPERALHSAEILASLAPESGHMVHMPGHIFFRVGDYARAEQSFAAAIQTDELYMREQHVDPENNWNYVHNLMYAIANLMEEGKFKNATALSTKLTGARGQLESTLYINSARDSISRLNPRLPVALRTADWSQVLELTGLSASPLKPNLEFLRKSLIDFATGMRALEMHNLPDAKASSERFDAALSQISQQAKTMPRMPGMSDENPPKLEVMPDALLQPVLRNLSVMSLELQACLLTAQGKTADAKSTFQKAERAEENLGYHEPPNYIRPVGETEGATLLTINDWTGARAAFQLVLTARPRSGFVLYSIALTSEKSGDAAAAVKEYADFLTAWKDADSSLPQITHARAFIFAH